VPRIVGARVLLACLGVAGLLASCGGASETAGSAPSASSSPSATPSASSPGAPVSGPEDFLAAYVAADGAVIRHDQGGDVVSEGQAYAMLVAEVAGRDDVVRRVWDWTRAHLALDSGLLAFHADSHGKVLDSEAASDADVLCALALLRYDGPGADRLHSAGRRLARAVLAHETVTDGAGRPVLVAGPWARQQQVVNPSYLMPGVFTDLATLTGDRRWQGLASSSVAVVDRLTGGGSSLPSDWARVEGDRVVATGSGGGDGQPQYGPDAQRTPLWFATGCSPDARRLAAGWWPILQAENRSSATALSTDGSALDSTPSVVALLGAGGSAGAAGDDAGVADLDTGAAQANAAQPTYYGCAWLALAPALRAGRLTSCS
jgi:hypothetical protein